MTNIFSGTLTKDSEFCAVIMAGGSGTRFWPMSRRTFPKQYLALSPSGKSLLRETVDRLLQIPGKKSILIVTAESQVELVREHAPEAAILAEPEAKNTAPALGLAAIAVAELIGDVPMLCLPADHLIGNTPGIVKVFNAALDLVRQNDVLATIGIQPTFPETGFGYIKAGAELPSSEAREVEAFVEKPSREKAIAYLSAGNYFWNSGMFAWRPSVLLREVQKSLPHLATSLTEIKKSWNNSNEIRSIFGQITPISIDFGVMERAANVAMLPGVGFSWSDVGSWHSWAASMEERSQPNADAEATSTTSVGDVLQIGCQNTAVWASGRFVATVGLENVIVVETSDAVLVCRREYSQDVKKVVDTLSARGRTELL